MKKKLSATFNDVSRQCCCLWLNEQWTHWFSQSTQKVDEGESFFLAWTTSIFVIRCIVAIVAVLLSGQWCVFWWNVRVLEGKLGMKGKLAVLSKETISSIVEDEVVDNNELVLGFYCRNDEKVMRK